jgi:hypothetical protein
MGPVGKLLREAGEIIADRKRHTRSLTALALDRNGNEVYADDPRACRWCAVGALEKADERYPMSNDDQDVAFDLLCAAAETRGFGSVNTANHAGFGPDIYSDAIEAAAELGL